MTLASWDPRIGEMRCECFDVRLTLKDPLPVEFHHARFVHAGRWPGGGKCMVGGCQCERFVEET